MNNISQQHKDISLTYLFPDPLELGSSKESRESTLYTAIASIALYILQQILGSFKCDKSYISSLASCKRDATESKYYSVVKNS